MHYLEDFFISEFNSKRKKEYESSKKKIYIYIKAFKIEKIY